MNSSDPNSASVVAQSEQDDSLTPCHFIISHPDKPKFLVIRHSGDHWSPPLLKVPSKGALMYKPAEINRGMMNKYKLRTSVMRVVMEARNYAVIELELHASSQQQMQAVWMGAEEYARFRKRVDGQTDPFEKWLQEKRSGSVPALRAPWQRPGWYKNAESWFSAKLVALGIQATGSTQQAKAGWPAACLLRVATAQGNIHMKAAYAKPPGEARLTKILAEMWPEHIAEPLAVDEKRNWLMMRDFKMKNENRPSIEHLSEFAGVLGKIQSESMQHMDRWQDLNCINMDVHFLQNEGGRADDLYSRVRPLLTSGTNPLEEAEVEQLENAILKARTTCAELAAFNIPNTLSHLDYRPDNFFVEKGNIFIIDWSDVAISHPFMALCRTLDFLDYYAGDNVVFDGIADVNEETRLAMRESYLACFSGSLSIDKLRAAFNLAREVYYLFYFYYVAGQIQYIERETPHGELLVHLLCSRAKMIIRKFED